jgi:hypothetical protein
LEFTYNKEYVYKVTDLFESLKDFLTLTEVLEQQM